MIYLLYLLVYVFMYSGRIWREDGRGGSSVGVLELAKRRNLGRSVADL